MYAASPPRRTTRRRKVFTFLAAFFLSVGTMFGATPASASTTDEVESSILLLGTTWTGYIFVPDYDSADGVGFWSDEVQAFSTCTGWFASEDGHIVTAGHCVDPAQGRSLLIDAFLASQEGADQELYDSAHLNWLVEGPNEGAPIERVVDVIQPDGVEGAVITDNPLTAQILEFRRFEDGDLALLRVSGMSDTPALRIAEDPPEVGDEVTAIGFPGTLRDILDASRTRASFKSGTASSQQYSSSGVAGTEVNADIGSGMSGGPTINERGEVHGVNSYSLIDSGEPIYNFITNTDDLETFLKNNNVPFESGPEDDGSGTVLLVILIVGGVLVAGAAVLAMVYVKRRGKNSSQSNAPQPSWNNGSTPLSPAPQPQPMPVSSHRSEDDVPAPVPSAPVSTPTVSDTVDEPTSPVEETRRVFCSDCGKPNEATAKFCWNCGKPLNK